MGVDSNMDTESTLHVENKYYKANLVIQFGDDINNIKEGVIIVSDESEVCLLIFVILNKPFINFVISLSFSWRFSIRNTLVLHHMRMKMI